MPPTPIITVKNLITRYGDHLVIDQISFEVYPGEIFMIIGGSGCGKTTLLRNLIGLLPPAAGEIMIAGASIYQSAYSPATQACSSLPLDNNEENLRAKQLQPKIGVMYQSGALFGSRNLLANVALPLEELTELPADAIQEIAHDKLQMVGLADQFHYHLPAEISGGMQKRVALARALVLDPQIVFLDEPNSGLDPVSAAAIDQLIFDLNQVLGTTFVIISHDIFSIFNLAQRIILLHQGKIVGESDSANLKNSDNVWIKNFINARGLN